MELFSEVLVAMFCATTRQCFASSTALSFRLPGGNIWRFPLGLWVSRKAVIA